MRRFAEAGPPKPVPDFFCEHRAGYAVSINMELDSGLKAHKGQRLSEFRLFFGGVYGSSVPRGNCGIHTRTDHHLSSRLALQSWGLCIYTLVLRRDKGSYNDLDGLALYEPQEAHNPFTKPVSILERHVYRPSWLSCFPVKTTNKGAGQKALDLAQSYNMDCFYAQVHPAHQNGHPTHPE